MQHERYGIADAELLPRAEQEFTMFDKAVALGTRVVQLVGVAHADKIDGDATSEVGKAGHDVAP